MTHVAISTRFVLAVFLLACGSAKVRAQTTAPDAPQHSIAEPGSPFGIAWGFAYGFGTAPAETFVPHVRDMGGGFTKVYLFWDQIEPERGAHNWTAPDAYVNQLQRSDEGLIAVWSSSRWATRHATNMIPASPAKDPEDYYRFVHDLVSHYRGKVRYWQNDCEPNNPVYWSGSAAEFVAQLKVFHRAVKDADPDAVVVVGGYDGLFNPPGMWEFPQQKEGLAFFDHVIREAGDHFDLFDLRLYADPYTIPARVRIVRSMMAGHGIDKPIICTEYNGPGFFELPDNAQYVPLIAQWSDLISRGKSPEEVGKPIRELYERMDSLSPQTQMFLKGCAPALEEKLRRLQCRDLVMRNVLALSEGVQKTLYWDLWHDTTVRDDLMHLMYAKFRFMEYDGDRALRWLPGLPEGFRQMTGSLAGVQRVRRIDIPDQPSVYLFAVERSDRATAYVAWDRRDVFTGETLPPMDFAFPWSAQQPVRAVDALGTPVEASVRDGMLHLPLSVTPVFVEPTDPTVVPGH